MKITITKSSPYQSEYTITRENGSVESFSLDVKTYLLHDLTHFVVEQQLGYTKGFWGMLASGYSFAELFGKDNTLTEELRFIEKIVGPVQSVYSGHIPASDFPMYIEHLQFELDRHFLENCITKLKRIIAAWEHVGTGGTLTLEWNPEKKT